MGKSNIDEYEKLFEDFLVRQNEEELISNLEVKYQKELNSVPVVFPNLPKIEVKVGQPVVEGQDWWADEMTIVFRFEKAQQEKCLYGACLLFGSRKLATKEVKKVTKCSQRASFKMRMPALGLFTANDYILQLRYNERPYLECMFSVDAKGQVKMGTVAQVKENSLGYMQMDQNMYDDTGIKVMDLMGGKKLKEMARQYVMMKKFKDMCDKCGLGSMRWNTNLVVYSDGMQSLNRVAGYMAHMVYKNVDDSVIDMLLDDDFEESLHITMGDWETHSVFTIKNVRVLLSEKRADDVKHLQGMLELNAEYHHMTVALVGKESEIQQFFKMYPQLEKHFPLQNRVVADGAHVSEFVSEVFGILKVKGYVLTPAFTAKLIAGLKSAWEEKRVESLEDDYLNEFVRGNILERQRNRLMQKFLSMGEGKLLDKDMLKTLEEEDLDLSYFDRDDKAEFDMGMNRLNDMVGLKELKRNLSDFFLQTRFDMERLRLGLVAQKQNRHHMLFTGNPGTGKTTVAMLMGRLFHAMGVLSKGDVVKVDRSSLVGEYIGQTEKNVNEVLERARGNVLFVDEAYTLFTDKEDARDFGQRVLEVLLTVLSEPDPDMVVIFAGYKNDIERLMTKNDGLKGRFPHHFDFPDYNEDELTLIGKNLLLRDGYLLSKETEECIRNVTAEMLKTKDKKFANARWMNDFVEVGILKQMAIRVTSIAKPQKKDYQQVLKEDVLNAWQEMNQKTAEKSKMKRIGFVA